MAVVIIKTFSSIFVYQTKEHNINEKLLLRIFFQTPLNAFDWYVQVGLYKGNLWSVSLCVSSVFDTSDSEHITVAQR